MHGHGGGTSKPGKFLTVASVVLAIAAVGISFYGWLAAHNSFSDALFHALKSIEMDEVYNHLYSEEHETAALIYLNIGRFIGVAFVLCLSAATIWAIFGGPILRAWVRGRYRDHCVIVGGSRFADRMSQHLPKNVVHLHSHDDVTALVGHGVRMGGATRLEDLLARGAANKSAAVLIAMEDDMAGIDLALAAQRHAATLARPPRLILRLHDYWLAQRFHNLPGAERVESVSEPALAARDAVRRFPPYLIAADQGANQAMGRIHLLMLGEPDWLEAMMSEVLLSATTLTFGKPAITFGCTEPETFQMRLLERYPEIELEADLAFIELAGSRPWELPGLDMARLAPGPLTAVYCLFPNNAESLCAYLAFEQAARTGGKVQAPVFVLTEGHEFPDPVPGSALAPLQCVPIGGQQHTVRACALDADGPDLPEQRYHAAYLQFSAGEGEASRAWSELKEDFRISNRRAVAHVPAKLFDAGFDLRDWMAGNDVWSQLPSLAPGEALFRTPDERERLAMLEHNRWMADRRLGGWRYGKRRDNAARLHPDLIPFAQLSTETQDYDRKFIDLLSEIIGPSSGGMARSKGHGGETATQDAPPSLKSSRSKSRAR